MPPAAVVTPNLLVDPGYLFHTTVDTANPTNTVAGSKFTDSWTGWLPLGATTEGSTFSYETSVEAMSVAELFDPVKYATVSRSGTIAFTLADYTLTNLRRALNGGTITTTGTAATSMNSYALPTPGAEIRSKIGWESQDNTVRIIIAQALCSGTLEMAFQKAPDFTAIPMEWSMEMPSGASQPFSIFTAGVARA